MNKLKCWILQQTPVFFPSTGNSLAQTASHKPTGFLCASREVNTPRPHLATHRFPAIHLASFVPGCGCRLAVFVMFSITQRKTSLRVLTMNRGNLVFAGHACDHACVAPWSAVLLFLADPSSNTFRILLMLYVRLCDGRTKRCGSQPSSRF